jgi:hypothetical protein
MIFDYIPYDLFMSLLEMADLFEFVLADNTPETLNSGICTRDCD